MQKIILILLCFLFSSCGLLDSGNSVREIGIIEKIDSSSDNSSATKTKLADSSGPQYAEPEQMLETPDTVRAGKVFLVKVWTYVPDSCWEEDGADLDLEENEVTITPYDQNKMSEDRGCLDAFRFIDRVVKLTFDNPGKAVIRLKGRQIRNDSEEDTMVEYEKKIVVE